MPLFSLLHRFYEVDTTGEILVDGQRVFRGITQESLWNAIATVPQDTALFNRSLLENIRYGRPDASDDEVLARSHGRAMQFIHRESASGAKPPSSVTADCDFPAASASASRSPVPF